MNIVSRIRRCLSNRVFCISMQKTGTTSVGQFFRDFGFRWAGWPADEAYNWSWACYEGNYEVIFRSKAFRHANAFEDSPWFYPGFYRILYHRFPGSRFVLFERDATAWFQSLSDHAAGTVVGRTKSHCKIYRREVEYFDRVDRAILDEAIENELYSAKTMTLLDMEDHYKSIYSLHNREVKDFFQRNNPDALFHGHLDDPLKWVKLGRFLGVDVQDDYDAHANKTAQRNRQKV